MHKNAAPRKMHRPKGRVATACVVTLAMLTSPLGTAWAAVPGPKKRVLVVKVQRAADVPAIVATRVDGYLETLMGMDDALELVPASALVMPSEAPDKPAPSGPGPGPGRIGGKAGKDDKAADPAAAALAKAEQAATQAGKLAARKKWGEAIKSWSKAIGLYEQAAALVEHERYVAALVGRAFAYFEDGYDDNGEEELARVFVVSPSYQLAPEAPKSALAMAERVRARVVAAGVQLTVAANAPRAAVFVDGQSRGFAPVTIGDLARGTHLVKVVADGFEPFGQAVAIAEAGVEVQATLVGKPGAPTPTPTPEPSTPTVAAETGLEQYARSGDFGAAFQAAAKRLAQANKLDAIALSYVRASKSDYDLGVFVWEAGKQRVGAVEPARISGDLGGLQIAVLDVVEKTSVVIADMPPERVLVGRSPLHDGVMIAEAPKVETRPEPRVETRPEPRVETRPDSGRGPIVEPTPPAPRDEPKVIEPLVLEPIEAHVTTPAVTTTKKPRRDEDPAFYETWWFWTILGGLAAGSAAAIVLSQDSGPSGPGGFSATVTW